MAEFGYGAITGHEEEIRQLTEAVVQNHVSHAYLLFGEKGSGKHMLSGAFAMSLLCEAHEHKPCLVCPSCQKAMDHNHPDLIYVTHEKPNVLSVEEIRRQLVNTVDIRPYEGGRKVYIIEDAEKMNPQAQNALLKTIEEPPSYAVIILLSTSKEALLPTILSRCVTMPLKWVEDSLIEEYLVSKYKLPDYEARVISAFAQGNMGRAIKAASGEEYSQIKDAAMRIVRRINEMDLAAIGDEVKSLKDNKEQMEDYFDMLTMIYRDILVMKSSKEASLMIFSGERRDIEMWSERYSYEHLEQIFQSIDECRQRLNANVNFELSMESLFYTMKE